MALRVLLADESSTIKKVIQLALQDYAVEVRAVNVGIDVVAVAHQFKPDIIFADVLLQKRSGYDVSGDIKSDSLLNAVPVVLMWSGFMELDQDKYEVSRADAQLEKPFDVATLRKLVQRLVPKTKTQDLSKFLQFPSSLHAEAAAMAGAAAMPSAPPPAIDLGGVSATSLDVLDANVAGSSWNMETFDPIDKFTQPEESFQQLNLPKPPVEPMDMDQVFKEQVLTDSPDDEGDGKWVQTNLSRFQINLPEADLEADGNEELPVNYTVPEDKIDPETLMAAPPVPPATKPAATAKVATTPSKPMTPPPAVPQEPDEVELDLDETGHQQAASQTNGVPPQMNAQQLEQVIRAQSREVIESVVWKVVPELAKQIIERELKRLLEEKDSSPS